jgi:dynein heavy chain
MKGKILDQWLSLNFGAPGIIIGTNRRANNLKCIYEQLTNQKIQKISKLLETSKSSYFPTFKQIFQDVSDCLDEATDISLYLKTLTKFVENISGNLPFNEIEPQFLPMMHTLTLIWTNSKYYNVPSKIVVILREICNDVIEQASLFLSPDELFKTEPNEAIEKIKTVIFVCESLQNSFKIYKTKNAETEKPWNFESSIVFTRLNAFLSRVKSILELLDTIIEFNRLEKIEIGGTKGKILSSSVATIFSEFTKTLEPFKNIKYKVLDLDSNLYTNDLMVFQEKMNDLDKRIATVLCQGFDDCNGIMVCFRLLDSFSGLLNRPTIQKYFERKYLSLLSIYSEDLDVVYSIFLKEKDNPPLHPNMPPVCVFDFHYR